MRCAQLESRDDGRVDAGSQGRIGAVPGDRDGVTLRQNLAVAGVAEQELPLGKVLVEPRPVLVDGLAVAVVLRPDVTEQVTDAVHQLRLLAVRDDPYIHLISIRISRRARN